MKCPGQDTRYWKPGDIFEVKCPKCGNDVEFFKDDPARKCPKCGHRFLNPNLDFGCASYCPYAEQCIGKLPPELIAQKEDLLKDRTAIEMKRYFKQDFKRIGHAIRVARYAEQIGREESGNLAVILCAAYLHDIGIHEAEKKYGSAKGSYQEKEGPPIAKEILDKLGWREEVVEEVCQIIGNHHRPGKIDTLNFKILIDADWLVNLKDEYDITDKEKLKKLIPKIFLTNTGKKMAEEIYL